MKENRVLYRILKVICGTILKVLYRPKVYGTENIPETGGVVFVSNHKHAFDPVVVMTFTSRFVHYLAKESIFRGIHGKMLESIGIIKVDRSKRNPLAVMSAENVLSAGGAIGIFPEGTRNRTEEPLLKFKTGAVRMAQNTNALIIPCAIRGEFKVFKKGLEIEYGKPLEVSGMTVEEANDFVKNEVLSLLRK
jgi:1-acyl-sn-glycerol-3-phosphate acyltransferase